MDQETKNLVSLYLNEVNDQVSANFARPKGPVDVLWIVKAWTKAISIATAGNNYLVNSCQFIMRDTPPAKEWLYRFDEEPSSEPRRLRGHVRYWHGGRGPRADHFKRVDNPLINLASEHRKSLGKDSKKDRSFIHDVSAWQHFNLKDLSENPSARIFKADRFAYDQSW